LNALAILIIQVHRDCGKEFADIGASKSDIRAISVVTISERAGRTRARNRGLA
jgi:hypothetical protein